MITGTLTNKNNTDIGCKKKKYIYKIRNKQMNKHLFPYRIKLLETLNATAFNIGLSLHFMTFWRGGGVI